MVKRTTDNQLFEVLTVQGNELRLFLDQGIPPSLTIDVAQPGIEQQQGSFLTSLVQTRCGENPNIKWMLYMLWHSCRYTYIQLSSYFFLNLYIISYGCQVLLLLYRTYFTYLINFKTRLQIKSKTFFLDSLNQVLSVFLTENKIHFKLCSLHESDNRQGYQKLVKAYNAMRIKKIMTPHSPISFFRGFIFAVPIFYPLSWRHMEFFHGIIASDEKNRKLYAFK